MKPVACSLLFPVLHNVINEYNRTGRNPHPSIVQWKQHFKRYEQFEVDVSPLSSSNCQSTTYLGFLANFLCSCDCLSVPQDFACKSFGWKHIQALCALCTLYICCSLLRKACKAVLLTTGVHKLSDFKEKSTSAFSPASESPAQCTCYYLDAIPNWNCFKISSHKPQTACHVLPFSETLHCSIGAATCFLARLCYPSLSLKCLCNTICNAGKHEKSLITWEWRAVKWAQRAC